MNKSPQMCYFCDRFLFTSVQKERHCPLVDTTLNQRVLFLFHVDDTLLESFLQRMTPNGIPTVWKNRFPFMILGFCCEEWRNLDEFQQIYNGFVRSNQKKQLYLNDKCFISHFHWCSSTDKRIWKVFWNLKMLIQMCRWANILKSI